CPSPCGRDTNCLNNGGTFGWGVVLLPPFRRLFARLGELGELVLLPLAAALGKDAVKEDGGGFGVGVLRPPVLGEFALDRCLENCGSIPLQIGSHPLQGGDPSIEVGEELLDLGDDAALLVEWGYREENASKTFQADFLLCYSCGDLDNPATDQRRLDCIDEITPVA